MKVINVTDQRRLTELLNTDPGKVKIVYFYTDDSAECKQMTDVMDELKNSIDYKDVFIVKVNASKSEDLSKKYDVNSVPTIHFHLNQDIADKLIGADVPTFLKKLNEQVTKASKNAELPTEELNTKLKRLINKSHCMLFMKGSTDAPRCGFSKQVIALLESHNAEYETFDILEDLDVREGLKKYSNWPTYPQLYIDGELIGGIDILKELSMSGELASLLSTKTDIDKRLAELINKSSVMVFMKGSPDAPRCGFSKTLISILKETGVEYSTFDILEDNTVREGLKKYSNWPTYPQIYVKGNLIGGIDIIKELHESGELKAALEEK